MDRKIVSSHSNENNNLRLRDQNQNNENNNNNNNEEIINSRIKQIMIEYECCTPYFRLGKTIFFYFPNSLKDLGISNKYYTNSFDLSQMPDPPFAIGNKCKYLLFNVFKVVLFYVCFYVYSLLCYYL